jgi:putative endonuclease
MFYVYYLRSQLYPDRTYIGFTANLKQRLADHNSGKSVYTSPLKPWKLVGFLGFDQELKALRFEHYLKSNAGRIFLKRYFADQVNKNDCQKSEQV